MPRRATAQKMPGGNGPVQRFGAEQLLKTLRLLRVEFAPGLVLRIGVDQIVAVQEGKHFLPVHQCRNVIVRVEKLIELAKQGQIALQ